ncbi:hypothetical protein [Xanthocytophaga agilis]|uniref:Lipoprotein n=1 Tax=Xanthocytophaga agilis TaxID=3048010 RepID=A0AAE3RB57_9BACT|nr:hypothetical protein [Xanthocytophaga agilis]MDJ1504739.1 hypothetical protein [Xanthocytophaga agilis]
MKSLATINFGVIYWLTMIGSVFFSCSDHVQVNTIYQLDSTQFLQVLIYLKQDSSLRNFSDSTDKDYMYKRKNNQLIDVDLAIAWRDYRLNEAVFRNLTQQEWVDFFTIKSTQPEQIKRIIKDTLINLANRETNYHVKINHDWVKLSPGYDTHLVIFFTRVNSRIIQTHIFPKMYYDDYPQIMDFAGGEFPVYTFFFDKNGNKIVKVIFGMTIYN